MTHSRAALIRSATAQLDKAGVDDPGRDARLLMRWASDLDGAGLATAMHDAPHSAQADRFAAAVVRRVRREPLSHITGQRLFWDRAFHVTSDVLDPRPESEMLIAEALHRGPFQRILDIGTGSGCLLLTLLAEWPAAAGTGTDASSAAIEIARKNADILDVADRADLTETDWTDGVDGPFDLIVTNPPYIAEAEIPGLSPEVRLFEPRAALTPGGDGLAAYHAIAPRTVELLNPGGLVLFEIGPTQYDAVAAILASAGLSVRMLVPDLDQRPRVVVAQA